MINGTIVGQSLALLIGSSSTVVVFICLECVPNSRNSSLCFDFLLDKENPLWRRQCKAMH